MMVVVGAYSIRLPNLLVISRYLFSFSLWQLRFSSAFHLQTVQEVMS